MNKGGIIINEVFPLPFFGPKDIGPIDAYVGGVPTDHGYREPRTELLVETKLNSKVYASKQRQITWREIQRGCDGAETTASIEAGLDVQNLGAGGTLGTRHFSHLLEQLSPDRRVLIVQSLGASPAKILFWGYPLPQTVDWSTRGESISVQCVCAGYERMRSGFFQQIRGRLMRFAPTSEWDPADPDYVLVEALSAVFNAGGRPNRSADPYEFTQGTETYRVHLFVDDDSAGAEYWRYVDVLRYLLLFYDVRATGGPPVNAGAFYRDTAYLVDEDELEDADDPFERLLAARAHDLSCRSLSLLEAVTLVCDTARLHWTIDVENNGTAETPEPEHRFRLWASLDNEAAVAATADREMGSPVIDDLPREAPFTDLGDRTALEIAEAGAIVKARFSIDNRRVQPIHVGGPKLHEVTLLLRPWWYPHAELDDLTSAAEQEDAIDFWIGEFFSDVEPGTSNINSQYHTKHPSFASVRDIGRRWGFPDTTEGLDPNYARTNFPAELYSPFSPDDSQALVYAHGTIGAGIEAARDWVPRQRPFLRTIGRREGNSDRAPVVWLNFNATDPYTALQQSGWIPMSHGFQVDERRAIVTIIADNLLLDASLRDLPEVDPTGHPNQYLRAFIEGRLQMAITCCIADDRRMYYEPTPPTSGAERMRYQLHDAGDEDFPFSDRSHNTAAHFARGGEFLDNDDPAYQEINATPRFEKFADDDAKYKARPVPAGPVETFWLDDRWRLGDGFSGCEGLGLDFEAYPAVQRLQWINGPGGHRTVLHLTDLRETPEVEAAG